MARLAALIVLLIPSCVHSQPNTQLDELSRTSSPYDLARYIDSHTGFEWESLWRAMGITDPPSMQPCEPPGNSCTVHLFTEFQPTQVILVVENWPFSAYLRFRADGTAWRYAGAFEAYHKNYPPRHEITRMNDKTFLRISNQGASGSDIDSEVESWLDLSLPGFRPVFGFTVQGRENRFGFGVSRRVHANARPGFAEETIELDLEVHYSMYEDRDLGFARYTGIYGRATNRERFSLQAVRAGAETITQQDFEELANISGADSPQPSNEKLLTYTLPSLKEIAIGPDDEARGWLKSILEFCNDSAEKRELQALLSRKQ